MRILASLPGVNLFSSPPSNPRINEPHAPIPPPLPIKKLPKKPPLNPSSHNAPPNPAFKSTHYRTKYYKPVSDGVIATAGDRSVVVGESGVSYLLPGAPFEFQYSYSETPKAKPLAIREPAFLPFAPPTMPRPWTGKAPLKSKKEKELKKQRKIRLLEPLNGAPTLAEVGKVVEMARAVPSLGQYPNDGRSREEILGKPLTRAEVRELVKPLLSTNRQVNLGRDGLTHNMLELVHAHWRRHQVCKVRCRGVPTVDMDNVCHHLEEKTVGKIIHRAGGVVYLFRGRNYNPRTRPRYPVMLWKPAAPVYPKLIQEAPDGLTKEEADELRMKGQSLLPICKLAKNGIYISLVKDVRDAFEGSPLVKINCHGLDASDYKKIGAKLKELVPCVLLSFDQEQILMWRGQNWISMYQISFPLVSNLQQTDNSTSSNLNSPDQSNSVSCRPIAKKEISSPRLLSLWKRAIESSKALLLAETILSPDALLEKVEEFEGMSQAAEHSYPALIFPSEVGTDVLKTDFTEGSETENSDNDDGDASDIDAYSNNDDNNSFEEFDSSFPLGSLPVDSLAKRLSGE